MEGSPVTIVSKESTIVLAEATEGTVEVSAVAAIVSKL